LMRQSTILLDAIWSWHPYAKITKLMPSSKVVYLQLADN
jgi:hypothetical protein